MSGHLVALEMGNEMKPFSLDDFMDESNRIEGMWKASAADVAATARFLSRVEVITISDLVELVKVYRNEADPLAGRLAIARPL